MYIFKKKIIVLYCRRIEGGVTIASCNCSLDRWDTDIAWAVVRGISTSLSHGICTMIVGNGIVYVRKQKKLFYTGTFALLTASMTLHAIFNLLIQSSYDYIALALPIVLYLLYWVTKLRS